jgi:two-component system, chemotaxis family, CheB/CheR fusion protein
LIEARRHRLQVKVPAVPLIEGDLLRLTQVLSNLLNNAAKYTDEGGQIQIDAEQVGRDVVIRVADDGVGMSAEMVPRVFDLFSQADHTLDRSKGGLGLGLTLVRQLVKLPRGSVEARSEGLGKGSEFVVRLPLASVPAPVKADSLAPSAATPAGSRRVLVVDDNADAAESLALVLRLHGHEVWVANEGREALAVADRCRPDVVILDIGLPGMDGYHLVRSLKGRAHTAKATLITVTGYGQPEDVERARAAGFDHHLVKPVEPSTVNSLLGEFR